MKYNLGMVTYVIPMFRYGRMDACEEIVDCMIERWNDHDLELKISKSEFEQIQEASNHVSAILLQPYVQALANRMTVTN